jgi:hypothetical protein
VGLNSADEIGALPQTPVWGEQFNGQPLWGLANLCRRTRANSNKKILELPSTLERSTPVPTLG